MIRLGVGLKDLPVVVKLQLTPRSTHSGGGQSLCNNSITES